MRLEAGECRNSKMGGRRASLCVIQWVNCLTLTLSIAVVGLGILLATKHGNCEKFMTTPVLITGGFIMCVSIIGFIGAMREVSLLLWAYLFLMCILLGAMAGFTLFTFVATHHAGAKAHTNVIGDHDYRLQDYSRWLQNLVHNKENWDHLKSCFVKPTYCSNLKFKYKTLQAYQQATLNPIEAGCCRPPSECGFLPRNSSYYNIQNAPLSSHKDCKVYKNSISVKCYDCDSCKGVIAHYLRKEWRVVGLVNIILFTMLIVLYSIAYYTRNVNLKPRRT